MQNATLVFLVRGNPPTEILLGLKNRDFGKGKYNGFGGKVKANETITDAAARELEEECGVRVSTNDLQLSAQLEFFFPHKAEWNQKVSAFLAERWSGAPIETDEMKPVWFDTNSIPYDKMWEDDAHWLPLVLQGKRVEASFVYKADNETVAKSSIEIIK